MKKNGFTLTEVLLTLAIIGIIAALVAPRVANNIQNAYAGATLGQIVQQIEDGCQKMLADANNNNGGFSMATVLDGVNVGDISFVEVDGVGEQDSLAENFALVGYKYLNLEPLSDDEEDELELRINNYDGTLSDDNAVFENSEIFRHTDLPASVYIIQENMPANANNRSQPDLIIATINIDINGFNGGPNRYGQDIFQFFLRNDGKVIPYGIQEDDSFEDNCSDANITDGKACSARVAADKWRITYR